MLSPASRIVIVQNQETDPGDRLLQQITGYFQAHGMTPEAIRLPSRSCPVVRPEGQRPDLVLVLGGDGTFLRAARCFAMENVPLVGVNTGHLGFLTRIEADKITPHLEAIWANDVSLEYRMMLAVRTDTELALNDVVVKNANPSRLAKMTVYIGEAFLAAYDADGVVVCTPTGSTAYNLSAGGPMMDPGLNVLAITPICPHSLSAKPIVVPADRPLTLASDKRNATPLVCALDGDEAFSLEPGASFCIRQAPYRLPMISFRTPEDTFYAVLKRKLGWGANPRGISG